jgi:hypothetical protein
MPCQRLERIHFFILLSAHKASQVRSRAKRFYAKFFTPSLFMSKKYLERTSKCRHTLFQPQASPRASLPASLLLTEA